MRSVLRFIGSLVNLHRFGMRTDTARREPRKPRPAKESEARNGRYPISPAAARRDSLGVTRSKSGASHRGGFHDCIVQALGSRAAGAGARFVIGTDLGTVLGSGRRTR